MSDFAAHVQGALAVLVKDWDLTGLLALADRLDELNDGRAKRLRRMIGRFREKLRRLAEYSKQFYSNFILDPLDWDYWNEKYIKDASASASAILEDYVLRLISIPDGCRRLPRVGMGKRELALVAPTER